MGDALDKHEHVGDTSCLFCPFPLPLSPSSFAFFFKVSRAIVSLCLFNLAPIRSAYPVALPCNGLSTTIFSNTQQSFCIGNEKLMFLFYFHLLFLWYNSCFYLDLSS